MTKTKILAAIPLCTCAGPLSAGNPPSIAAATIDSMNQHQERGPL